METLHQIGIALASDILAKQSAFRVPGKRVEPLMDKAMQEQPYAAADVY